MDFDISYQVNLNRFYGLDLLCCDQAANKMFTAFADFEFMSSHCSTITELMNTAN